MDEKDNRDRIPADLENILTHLEVVVAQYLLSLDAPGAIAACQKSWERVLEESSSKAPRTDGRFLDICEWECVSRYQEAATFDTCAEVKFGGVIGG